MTTDAFKQINAFSYLVNRQSNTRHLSWMKQFDGRLQSEIITPMGGSVPALLTSAVAQLTAAVNHEDDCYLIIVKSEKTEQIANLDNQRDTKYVGVKSMADALKRIGTAEQQQFAIQLLDLTAHYKVDISERYDDETTKMDQLLQELQNPTWTPRIAALGLADTVAELASINQQMKQLIDERNNELATIAPQAMLQARTASDEAYALVVAIINALAITQWNDGSSPYDQAIARINQDQDYYTKNVFNVKPGSGGNSGGGGSDNNGGGSDNNGGGSDNNGGGSDNNGGGSDNNGGGSDNNGGGSDNNGGGSDNPGGGGDTPGGGGGDPDDPEPGDDQD